MTTPRLYSQPWEEYSFTVVHKTNRGKKSVKLTNTFKTKFDAIRFATERRKDGQHAVVYVGVGENKETLDA